MYSLINAWTIYKTNVLLCLIDEDSWSDKYENGTD